MNIEILERDFINSDISLTVKRELVHRYQLENNLVYRSYVNSLAGKVDFGGPAPIPIDIFKHENWQNNFKADLVFRSSGTGGSRSTHRILNADLYKKSIEASFKDVFGSGPFTFASHLPGYLESGQESSLLYMIRHLMKVFGNENGAGFLGDAARLDNIIAQSLKTGWPLVIFGAAFGLLDFSEKHQVRLPKDAIVIETGGMKTHRKEITRETLHSKLSDRFGIDRRQVYSEYGMCELLSQSYTRGGESFVAPHWMEVNIVDPEAPWRILQEGEEGAISLFDCANMHSLSFLVTGDLGKRTPSGFEVLGRIQNSELRGCNFLIEEYIK